LLKTGFGLFFVLASLGSLADAARPKSPAGNFVKTGALNRSATHPEGKELPDPLIPCNPAGFAQNRRWACFSSSLRSDRLLSLRAQNRLPAILSRPVP
jgi:hypothetical protein